GIARHLPTVGAVALARQVPLVPVPERDVRAPAHQLAGRTRLGDRPRLVDGDELDARERAPIGGREQVDRVVEAPERTVEVLGLAVAGDELEPEAIASVDAHLARDRRA